MVYSTHVHGSPCDAAIGDKLCSTIGYEFLHNERAAATTDRGDVSRAGTQKSATQAAPLPASSRAQHGPPCDGGRQHRHPGLTPSGFQKGCSEQGERPG